jgi:hypothetical protein
MDEGTEGLCVGFCSKGVLDGIGTTELSVPPRAFDSPDHTIDENSTEEPDNL